MTRVATKRVFPLNFTTAIGLMASIGAQRLSPFFARYQREYPHIELELIISNETDLLNQLDSELLDLVISASTQLFGEPYQSALIYQERYVVA
jgi:DNA-binding transcriptional LysR family regulator